MSYTTISKEGWEIEKFTTLNKAIKAIAEYEAEDEENGNFESGFYQIRRGDNIYDENGVKLS